MSRATPCERIPRSGGIAGEIFGCEPLIPVQTEEAAFGAALYAAISAGAIDVDRAKKLILYGGNEK